jgi:hypothetical protein
MRVLQLFLLAAIAMMVSCYRMPDDDDCSLIPTTNNPDVTGDAGSSPLQLPGGGF